MLLFQLFTTLWHVLIGYSKKVAGFSWHQLMDNIRD